ncbi:MAG: GNAT family N-acetyltransferase [Gemmatimonadaceae bacterium]
MDERTAVTVVHNEGASRFETIVDGHLGFADYVRQGNTITFTHTEVPDAVQGQGIGNDLARAALDYARAENLAVVPRCTFIAAYVREHREYQSLVRPAG